MSDAVVVALIGFVAAISTGVAAKLFDYRLNKLKHEFEKSVQIQSIEIDEIKMLKNELESRREEIRKLEEELDKWKGKYYEMLEHLITLRSKLGSQDV